jgi:putative RecB family exonuclease
MTEGTPVQGGAERGIERGADGVTVLGSLSPSRAGDFRTCPLMYRLRTIDRLPEEPSPDAVRGTVVHKVLEDLFDLPAAHRTPEQAEAMVQRAWELVLETEPSIAEMFVGEGPAISTWLASCRERLRAYFDLEDPRRIEPAERELYVETVLDSRLMLRGFVDRLDVAPDGSVRVVDYKTGRSPGVGFEAKALFQLRFYALVIWRTRGVVPSLLQLVYLGDAQLVSYRPDEQDLLATERLVEALWRAIQTAERTGEWLPRRSWACEWCSFQAHCPEFGNQPPPLPSTAPATSPSEADDAAAHLARPDATRGEDKGVGAAEVPGHAAHLERPAPTQGGPATGGEPGAVV